MTYPRRIELFTFARVNAADHAARFASLPAPSRSQRPDSVDGGAAVSGGASAGKRTGGTASRFVGPSFAALLGGTDDNERTDRQAVRALQSAQPAPVGHDPDRPLGFGPRGPAADAKGRSDCHAAPMKPGWPALTYGLATGSALLLAPFPAAAQSQTSAYCGVTGDATAPTTIFYDPFSSAGLSQATIPLILRRNRGILLGRTDEVSLILVAPAGTPRLEVTYQGYPVLYQEGSTAGRPRALTSNDNGAGAAGEIRYQFGGLFASDYSSPLNLRVTVPPGTDLSAGEPIILDILYICDGAGGQLSVPTPQRAANAVRLEVNTVSALQASYTGSTLDFGEIGGASTAAVQAAPDRYTTPATNALRVRSSGPFQVQVRSDNNFRLTYPGGDLASAAQTIGYRIRFLGQDITSNASFGTRTCARAGVAGTGAALPLRATLTEGGADKTPSANYTDTISVTFSPVVAASSPQSCANL